MVQVSLRPRLGECLSPERETKLLNPVPGRLGEKREPEPKMRLCNSRLGEMDSLGRKLQRFSSSHTRKQPKQCPLTAPTVPTSYIHKHIIWTWYNPIWITKTKGLAKINQYSTQNHPSQNI